MWKRPVLWISVDEILIDFCRTYFLIAYHLYSVNYFPLNRVLDNRAVLLCRLFYQLLSLWLLKLDLTLLSLLYRWKIRGWVDTLPKRQRVSVLQQWQFAVAQPCEMFQFWFWPTGSLRPKIFAVVTEDVLTGVTLIVKSGTSKSLMYLALIRATFTWHFRSLMFSSGCSRYWIFIWQKEI